jgi:hypothetical protein
MPGPRPARPDMNNRLDGGPLGGKHQKGEKWDRVPRPASLVLRFFLVLVVLSMAVATVMIIHLLAVPRWGTARGSDIPIDP